MYLKPRAKHLKNSRGNMQTLRTPAKGFSLIEVMVALIVISVGLLGIAKLEAVALSSTSTAANRSLAALQASSMAAAMHENRGYWTSTDAYGTIITAVGTVITVTGAGGANLAASLAAARNCESLVAPVAAPCSVNDMAAFDLTQWANWLQAALRNETAIITCGNANPVSCTVQITWNESSVATNTLEVAAKTANATAVKTADFENSSYTLYVQP